MSKTIYYAGLGALTCSIIYLLYRLGYISLPIEIPIQPPEEKPNIKVFPEEPKPGTTVHIYPWSPRFRVKAKVVNYSYKDYDVTIKYQVISTTRNETIHDGEMTIPLPKRSHYALEFDVTYYPSAIEEDCKAVIQVYYNGELVANYSWSFKVSQWLF